MSINLDKFWEKVKKSDGCWEWLACLNDKGYGIFGLKNGKVDRAHRISYRITIGEIPKDLFVCHHCDNRKCVNPSHLFLGTNLDNVKDMISKKRNSLPPNNAGWNRINYDQSIIDLFGKKPDTEIAKLTGSSRSAISRARKRLGIAAFPCQTRFSKGDPHPRWHKRNGG